LLIDVIAVRGGVAVESLLGWRTLRTDGIAVKDEVAVESLLA
jgi:hypothetical protein